MAVSHECCVCFLIWEWYLGHQEWIKAKSTIALVIMLSVIGFWAMIALFKKEK